MARQRRDAQHVAVARDAMKLIDLAYVDEHRWRGNAQIHHRHEALATGNSFGFIAVFGQQIVSTPQGVWRQILEPTRFHASSPCLATVSPDPLMPPSPAHRLAAGRRRSEWFSHAANDCRRITLRTCVEPRA